MQPYGQQAATGLRGPSRPYRALSEAAGEAEYGSLPSRGGYGGSSGQAGMAYSRPTYEPPRTQSQLRTGGRLAPFGADNGAQGGYLGEPQSNGVGYGGYGGMTAGASAGAGSLRWRADPSPVAGGQGQGARTMQAPNPMDTDLNGRNLPPALRRAAAYGAAAHQQQQAQMHAAQHQQAAHQAAYPYSTMAQAMAETGGNSMGLPSPSSASPLAGRVGMPRSSQQARGRPLTKGLGANGQPGHARAGVGYDHSAGGMAQSSLGGSVLSPGRYGQQGVPRLGGGPGVGGGQGGLTVELDGLNQGQGQGMGMGMGQGHYTPTNGGYVTHRGFAYPATGQQQQQLQQQMGGPGTARMGTARSSSSSMGPTAGHYGGSGYDQQQAGEPMAGQGGHGFITGSSSTFISPIKDQRSGTSGPGMVRGMVQHMGYGQQAQAQSQGHSQGQGAQSYGQGGAGYQRPLSEPPGTRGGYPGGGNGSGSLGAVQYSGQPGQHLGGHGNGNGNGSGGMYSGGMQSASNANMGGNQYGLDGGSSLGSLSTLSMGSGSTGGPGPGPGSRAGSTDLGSQQQQQQRAAVSQGASVRTNDNVQSAYSTQNAVQGGPGLTGTLARSTGGYSTSTSGLRVVQPSAQGQGQGQQSNPVRPQTQQQQAQQHTSSVQGDSSRAAYTGLGGSKAQTTSLTSPPHAGGTSHNNSSSNSSSSIQHSASAGNPQAVQVSNAAASAIIAGASGAAGAARTAPNGTEDVIALPHRIVTSVACVSAVGAVSWRGRNPAQTKVNQDSVVVAEHGPTSSLLVAVFDGHGVNGREVSSFFKERYPLALFTDRRFQSKTATTTTGPSPSKSRSPSKATRDRNGDKGSERGSETGSVRSDEEHESQYESGSQRSDSPGTGERPPGGVTGRGMGRHTGAAASALCDIMADVLLATELALIQASGINVTLSGSTAVVVLIRDGILHVCNIGDSRGILVASPGTITPITPAAIAAASVAATTTGNAASGFVPGSGVGPGGRPAGPMDSSMGSSGAGGPEGLIHPSSRIRVLTVDHKPENPKERQRILSTGGRVMSTRIKGAPHLLGPPRVWLKNAPLPGLNMSRSLGDLIAKQAGVISTPHKAVQSLHVAGNGNDRALILASDGLWDFVTNEEVGSVALSTTDTWESSARLARLARSRWLVRTGGADDTTVVIVRFASNAAALTVTS